MIESVSINTTRIQKWVNDNSDVDNIRNEMLALGFDESSIDAHIKEYKRIVYTKRQNKGFTFAAIGALMGFVSCVLSLTNPIPELYYVILYGFTTAAILVIFVGLYFIFE